MKITNEEVSLFNAKMANFRTSPVPILVEVTPSPVAPGLPVPKELWLWTVAGETVTAAVQDYTDDEQRKHHRLEALQEILTRVCCRVGGEGA